MRKFWHKRPWWERALLDVSFSRSIVYQQRKKEGSKSSFDDTLNTFFGDQQFEKANNCRFEPNEPNATRRFGQQQSRFFGTKPLAASLALGQVPKWAHEALGSLGSASSSSLFQKFESRISFRRREQPRTLVVEYYAHGKRLSFHLRLGQETILDHQRIFLVGAVCD